MVEQSRHERELIELRQELDAIDDELVRLLNRRASLSLKVGDLKRRQGDNTPIFVPEREAEVLGNVRRANKAGPLRGAQLEAIYRQILSSSRDLQRRPRVAYLGPPATFSNQAAL